MALDSTEDTLKHIARVRTLIGEACTNLEARAVAHDLTKLQEPEKSLFDEYTPRLADMEYGSPEYMECLDRLRPALDHHYAENSHHPEHYGKAPDGIKKMSLFDLVEMLLDWKAAGERHDGGGDLRRSIEVNQGRFGYGDELREILENTARELKLF